MSDVLVTYTQHSLMTDPGAYKHLIADLPADFTALRDIVQGQLLHIFWAESYGVQLTEVQKGEVNFRLVSRQLARLTELTSAPLTQAQPPANRLIGNCRDFSTFLCALLRQQGIPARARAGFGTYFLPDHYEDHWVCEVWDAAEARWRLIDAQLDAHQVGILKPDFDPLDVPRNRFITGSHAWQMIRGGAADPDKFGIFDMKGWWFVRGNLIRDFLALNRIELLPWDYWPEMVGDAEARVVDVDLMDTLADLGMNVNTRAADLWALYATEPRLQPPPGWSPAAPTHWPAALTSAS